MGWPTWPDLVSLLWAIAALIASGSLGVFLWRRPDAKVRVKHGGSELQLEGAEPSKAPEIESATDERAQLPPSTDEDVKDAGPEVEDEGWFVHFDRGDYAEGRNALEAHLETIPDPVERLEYQAFAVQVAAAAGSPTALDDLNALLAAHPSNSEVQLWGAFGMGRLGRIEEMTTLSNRAFTVAENDDERASAAIIESSFLEGRKESAVVAEGLVERARSITDPRAKARVLARAGKLRLKGTRGRTWIGLSLLERAIQLDPTSDGARFDLAYGYSESSAPALAFLHYLRLVKRKPDHPSAQNNLGVAASKLGMEVEAVRRYKAAEELGETLPTANLARKLIHAGFVDEATERLRNAQDAEDVHGNVLDALGGVAKARSSEEELQKEITARMEYASQVYARAGDAMAVGQSEIRGPATFSSKGFLIRLEPTDDELLSGHLIMGGAEMTVSGYAHQGAVAFSWREKKDDEKLFQIPREGHGVLVVETGGGKASGFVYEGSDRLDPWKSEGWKELNLTRSGGAS